MTCTYRLVINNRSMLCPNWYKKKRIPSGCGVAFHGLIITRDRQNIKRSCARTILQTDKSSCFIGLWRVFFKFSLVVTKFFTLHDQFLPFQARTVCGNFRSWRWSTAAWSSSWCTSSCSCCSAPPCSSSRWPSDSTPPSPPPSYSGTSARWVRNKKKMWNDVSSVSNFIVDIMMNVSEATSQLRARFTISHKIRQTDKSRSAYMMISNFWLMSWLIWKLNLSLSVATSTLSASFIQTWQPSSSTTEWPSNPFQVKPWLWQQLRARAACSFLNITTAAPVSVQTLMLPRSRDGGKERALLSPNLCNAFAFKRGQSHADSCNDISCQPWNEINLFEA